MNAVFLKQAMEKVGDAHLLVNLVSRRVRQLQNGGGGTGRPLIMNVGNLGLADIALLEIIEEKIGWDIPELPKAVRLIPKKRRR
jgi:DNA-directed RNA polymerase subunit K/omega